MNLPSLRILLATAAFFFSISAAPAADGAKGFQTVGVQLYLPNDAMQKRVPNVQALATFIKAVQQICTEHFASSEIADSLAIVVAIKPGNQARYWFVSSRYTPDGDFDTLRAKLAKIPAPTVVGGPVTFAIQSSIAGGAPKTLSKELPIPKEWKVAAQATNSKEPLRVPDGFLKLVWPGSEFDETIPAEFVTQVLEPLGGKILRPKDWFYSEGHHGPVYIWTLSREDTSGNRPYTTGVRIQTFTDIKAGAGKTAKQFILDFVASKKKEATKVITTRAEKEEYLFTRIGLETEEGPYHILYSLFWGSNDLDIAVVSIAGTTKEHWATYAPIFDKMSVFELIDIKRFKK